MENVDVRSASEIALAFSDLTILPAEIYSCMGYRDSGPDTAVQAIVDSLLAEASALCRPRLGFRIVDGRIEHGSLFLSSVRFAPDAIIAHCLSGCTQYAVVVASVGREMDEWIHGYRAETDLMNAFVADVLGSVVAEAIMSYGCGYLERQQARQGLKITNSYSPGYCGWNVAEQQQLFGLLPAGFCGVTLCESSLMLPIKSVSSVVGIGTNARKRAYGCAICRKEDCYKRRIRP